MSDVLRVLPPGVEEATFDDALGELRRAVGDENVIDDPAGLEPYRDPIRCSATNSSSRRR